LNFSGSVRPYRTAISFLLFLAVVFVFVGRADPTVFNGVRLWTVDRVLPVLETVSKPITASIDYISRADDIVALYEENERLRAENEQLREWRDATLRLERTLERYQALLNVRVGPDISFVTARVVAETGGPFLRTFIVNAGTADNVANGHAVIDGDGLVGRVAGAGQNASRILLLTDLNSKIPVFIEPGHFRALLTGDNSNRPRLEHLPEGFMPSPGDRVITSGHGGLLPAALPVGAVVDLGDGDHNRVDLFSNPARTEFVRIIRFQYPTTIEDAHVDDAAQPSDNAPTLAETESEEAVAPAPRNNSASNGVAQVPTSPSSQTE
jgi:rod shape-determining protein MreC